MNTTQQIEQIETCCPCGRPLIGVLTRHGRRTSLSVRDAAAGPPPQAMSICPGCGRRLPVLTAEQFKDAVAQAVG